MKKENLELIAFLSSTALSISFLIYLLLALTYERKRT